MTGLICFYSGSGNTRLACAYLARHVTAVKWTMCDIVRDPFPDLGRFDVVGFACFTDFWGVPQRMIQFMKSVPEQNGRLAFTFTTFGMLEAFALRDLSRLTRNCGMRIIGGFSLHTPENFPPMICSGLANRQAPSAGEMKGFRAFLARLDAKLKSAAENQAVSIEKPGENILSWLGALKRTHSRKNMGKKFVDESLCTKCRICEKGCPYKAITLNPYPVFDMNSCYGCWACYNRCPEKAIYTAKYRERGHYPSPIEAFALKMKD